MTMQCSKMDSNPAIQIICPVDICIEEHQCLNNLPVAILAGLHQSSLPPVIPEVDLHTGFEQQRNNLMVTLRRGVVQRRVAAAECGVAGQPGVVLEERARLLQVAVPGRRDEALAGGRAPEGVAHEAEEPHGCPKTRPSRHTTLP